jgi:G3E family GTPase
MRNINYLLLSFLLWPLVSMSAEKHVHGEAELFIAIEDNQVLLEFQSPADNIIGFEHAPATELQFSQLENSLKKLKDHKYLAAFKEGACQQISAEVKSPFKDDHKAEKHKDDHEHTKKEHGHKEHSHKEHSHDEHSPDKGSHSDFYVSYTLQCEAAEDNIGRLDINAFEHFAGIKNITVKWITSDKQGSAKATAANKVIDLN